MRVRLIAPSKIQRQENIAAACRAVNWAGDSLGWKVELDPQLGARHSWGGAGSGMQRALSLEWAMEGADLVMCSTGGDHGAELLPFLASDPAWPATFIGTSDNAMLALVLHARGLRTACGPDLALSDLDAPASLGQSRTLDFTWTREQLSLLTDRPHDHRIQVAPEVARISECLRPGDVLGTLLATNTSSLLKIAGTAYWPGHLFAGSVLCLERYAGDGSAAVAELVHLDQLGVFAELSGLVLGWWHGFDATGDTRGWAQVRQAVLDLTEPYDLPVWRLGVLGHRCPHALLPNGALCRILPGGEMIVDYACW